MRKLITLTLVLCLALALAAPVAAITTGSWDFGAAQASVSRAVEKMQDEEKKEQGAQEEAPERLPAAPVIPAWGKDWSVFWGRWWKK